MRERITDVVDVIEWEFEEPIREIGEGIVICIFIPFSYFYECDSFRHEYPIKAFGIVDFVIA